MNDCIQLFKFHIGAFEKAAKPPVRVLLFRGEPLDRFDIGHQIHGLLLSRTSAFSRGVGLKAWLGVIFLTRTPAVSLFGETKELNWRR